MNNNQNTNIKPVNNGEAKPSSLSGVRKQDNETNNLADISKRRTSTPSGMRAEDYARLNGLNGGLPNNQANNLVRVNAQSQNQSQQASINKSPNTLDDKKKALAQEAIKQYAAMHGVPKQATEKVMNSKAASMLTNSFKKKNFGSRLNDWMDKRYDDTSSKKDKSEQSVNEKSDETEKKQIRSGEITVALSLKKLKIIAIATPIITIFLVLWIAILSVLNDDKTSQMILGEMASTDSGRELMKDAIDEMHSGNGDGNLAIGMGDDEFPQEYYDRLASLGNVYSTQGTCEGEECLERPEFLYYLKIADISMRYRNKYSVDLDWYLITATNLYMDGETEEVMQANNGGYNLDTVDNYSTLSELDWDYDFKNIAGYTYLDPNDSKYDLNILAKNMVTKTTIQTCSNASGDIIKTQTDTDVEDKYFDKGQSKRLNCASGQTYSISSTYVKDMDKFDEFMLEYIDKKMFGSSSTNPSETNPSESNPTNPNGNTQTPPSSNPSTPSTPTNPNPNNSTSNSLADAFVNLAVEQINDPSAVGGEKYWRYMGWNKYVAWCATFVSWNIGNASYNGQKVSDVIKQQTSSVDGFMNYFYNSPDENIKFYYNDNCSNYSGKNGSGTYTPKRGDLIFFDWDKKWDGTMPSCHGCGQDHVGIVQRVENGNIITIEGNTSNAVHERSYKLNSCEVIGFGSWY